MHHLNFVLTISEVPTCSICMNCTTEYTECPKCGYVCGDCASICPHDLTDAEMIALREQALCAAQTRLAKAEAMLVGGTAVDHYWEEQRDTALNEVEEAIAALIFCKWAIAEDARQAA